MAAGAYWHSLGVPYRPPLHVVMGGCTTMQETVMSLEHSPARSDNPWRSRGQPLADRFLSRAEAAEFLGLSESLLASDVVTNKFKIPRHKFGNRVVRYRLSELIAWAEGQKVPA
jgi:predicted DNA-binding transcriptional regulator AlpA